MIISFNQASQNLLKGPTRSQNSAGPENIDASLIQTCIALNKYSYYSCILSPTQSHRGSNEQKHSPPAFIPDNTILIP